LQHHIKDKNGGEKLERARLTAKSLQELTESYTELHRAIKSTAATTEKTKKLWREGNKSNLIRIGIACIVFPDPSPVTEIIGAGFLIAGAVQKGMQSRAGYLNDVKSGFEGTIRELNRTKYNL
jgi:hypothetical protein